jgi:hypothetical protein
VNPKDGKCWHCGVALTSLDYGRQDTCRKCGRDTKVCRNCEHYERGVNNDCREDQAERVVDKERSNFCDYFRPSDKSQGGAQARDAMKVAAEALFKKPKAD